jgi:hypothetical protein
VSTEEETLIDWLSVDARRMSILRSAATLALSDWCVAAGFVRNLVWDRLHGYEQPQPLSDIDLIYFDAESDHPCHDEEIEARLRSLDSSCAWSVRNQARMHLRNGDHPYRSTADAMSYWPEIETAVGVRLDPDGRLRVIAPFGMASLFGLRLTPNPKRSPDDFAQRLAQKRWLSIWPRLQVATER